MRRSGRVCVKGSIQVYGLWQKPWEKFQISYSKFLGTLKVNCIVFHFSFPNFKGKFSPNWCIYNYDVQGSRKRSRFVCIPSSSVHDIDTKFSSLNIAKNAPHHSDSIWWVQLFLKLGNNGHKVGIERSKPVKKLFNKLKRLSECFYSRNACSFHQTTASS